MKERLNKLLSVKSLVTMAMTIVFCVLAIRGVISGQEFLTIFTTVIAFYFGTQSAKSEQTSPVKTDTAADTKTDSTENTAE